MESQPGQALVQRVYMRLYSSNSIPSDMVQSTREDTDEPVEWFCQLNVTNSIYNPVGYEP